MHRFTEWTLGFTMYTKPDSLIEYARSIHVAYITRESSTG